MDWGMVTLGDICSLAKGKTGITKAIPGKYPMVALSEERKTHNEYQLDAAAVIIPLVSSTGHGHASMKRIHFQSGKFAFGTILCALIPNDPSKVSAEFLYHYLDMMKEILFVPLMKGVANVALPMKRIAGVEIPLPSLRKQESIVEILKRHKAVCRSLDQESDKQNTLLQQYRQAILQEAIEGKLTADWREEHPDVEPASELLKRIAAEKAELVKQKKIRKQKPLPEITPDDIPFDIPEAWQWCKIDRLVVSMATDLRTGPFGSSLQKSEHRPHGVPVWGIESIGRDGSFTHRSKIFVSEEKAWSLKSFYVEGGDIVISRSGTVGELCILPQDIPDGLISTNLMKLSLAKHIILPQYFCYQIKGGQHIKESLYQLCSGSTRLFLTQTILKKLKFALPPLAEQQEIVSRVEAKFAICDELEAQINSSAHTADTLSAAILQELFDHNGGNGK